MHKPCKAVQVSLLPHFGGVAPGGKKTCHQYLIRDPGENVLWHCLNMLGALACCFVQHLSTIIVGNPKNRLASCKAQQLVAGCESAKIQSIEKGNVPNQDDWNWLSLRNPGRSCNEKLEYEEWRISKHSISDSNPVRVFEDLLRDFSSNFSYFQSFATSAGFNWCSASELVRPWEFVFDPLEVAGPLKPRRTSAEAINKARVLYHRNRRLVIRLRRNPRRCEGVHPLWRTQPGTDQPWACLAKISENCGIITFKMMPPLWREHLEV